MSFDHDTLVGFAKSFGLFYLILLSVGVLVYALWPRNKARFDHAKRGILEDDGDRPLNPEVRNERTGNGGR